MSAILKSEILDTIQDCISILSRGEDGIDVYEYQEKMAELEAAYHLLASSKIYFSPVYKNAVTIH
jgi:hypothetical protein